MLFTKSNEVSQYLKNTLVPFGINSDDVPHLCQVDDIPVHDSWVLIVFDDKTYNHFMVHSDTAGCIDSAVPVVELFCDDKATVLCTYVVTRLSGDGCFTVEDITPLLPARCTEPKPSNRPSLLEFLRICSYPVWVDTDMCGYKLDDYRDAVRTLKDYLSTPVTYVTVDGNGELCVEAYTEYKEV